MILILAFVITSFDLGQIICLWHLLRFQFIFVNITQMYSLLPTVNNFFEGSDVGDNIWIFYHCL